ncbi:acyl CoA:acetate/3-ketoacid CoA transferase beta subunit [Rhodococcus sp. AG1013]|uniref:CoA-transferase subunit beta n=1 Tax=Rhodococcus sp. AG1013 TaxID=2183996 RepID=UPI000E0C8A38|nr:CoA-transferase [Rhodococcus sp. AG1013]RDI17565.1 acyl CoA:acetate/3-ketoacid CoA transferase beta subunit [Rhodococcus sp. AG1013]
MTEVTRAEYCAIACAELFADAGEIFASPMATLPLIGARLAKLTTEPDLIITDGEALILADAPAIGASAPIEGYIPFSKVFDVVASGRRHVVMGANQIDKFGNQNLSAFGPLDKPTRQMFGLRGAPGNTINHATSYWVGKHSTRVFAEQVDVVCGVGYDKVDPENPAFRFLKNHQVVTNLGVFDFQGPNQTMRAVSLHPGVTAEDVKANTSFEIAGLAEAGITREPTAEELRLIREVIDPRSLRDREVSA